MPEITDREIEMIHQTYKSVIEIATVLGDGNPNTKGLCYDVRCQGKRLWRLEIIMAFLLGGGGIIGGGIGLANWLGG